MTRCVERVDSGATRRRSRSPPLIPVSLAKTRLRRKSRDKIGAFAGVSGPTVEKIAKAGKRTFSDAVGMSQTCQLK